MRPYRLSIIAADDPYPYYRELRDSDPAHHSEPEGIWVLTRYNDVSEAFANWRDWSSQRRGNLVNDMPARIGRTLGTSDPPAHRFARGLVEKAFTRKTVDGIAPRIADLSAKLAGLARERESVELVSEVSAPFNAAILGAMFGMRDDDFLRLRCWLDDFFLREPTPPGEEPKQDVAMRKLHEFLDTLASEREANPSDDLMSTMLQAQEGGRKLSRPQAVVTAMTFLAAGFESTNNLITNLVHALGQHPEVYQQLKESSQRIPAFIDECTRWDAPAQGFVRSPTRDVLLHGKTIPEGSQVLLHIGSANRDERAFQDPDRLDIERPNHRQLSYGKGIHFCVGAPLAREMAQALIAALVAVSRTWEIDAGSARRVTTPNFRGFSVLPLRI